MRTITRIALPLAVLLALVAPAHASQQIVRTELNDTDMGQTTTGMYQGWTMPKLSASGHGGFTEHFQVYYIDGFEYNFVYFQVTEACKLVVGSCVTAYKIEVTYQIHDSSQLHDGFLSDWAFPGDYLDFVYNETGGNGASAQIVNNGASGHGSWNHTGTWTWSGTHPRIYENPHFTFIVDNFGFGRNCIGDMPAQNTPGSSSHVGSFNYLGIVTLADGTQISASLLAANVVTSVSPTSCNLSFTTGTYGPYTTYNLSWYGGG